MDIRDSADVRNHVKIRSVVIALVIHAVLAIATVGISLLLLIGTAVASKLIVDHEVKAVQSGASKFKRSFPFNPFGVSFGDFQHVFFFQDNLGKELIAAIERELLAKTPVEALETIKLTDIDNQLAHPEDRVFMKAEAGRTIRGTTVTLVMQLSNFGQMQSIRWWVLAGGFVDRDKMFNFVSYSLFTLPFWIVPYLKRQYDVLSQVRTIYAASYNDMDVVTQVRCLHEAVFDAMVVELERRGIDTSDIKAQRMQVMNINISGGKVNMGNVVQGAMNRVVSKMQAAKA